MKLLALAAFLPLCDMPAPYAECAGIGITCDADTVCCSGHCHYDREAGPPTDPDAFWCSWEDGAKEPRPPR